MTSSPSAETAALEADVASIQRLTSVQALLQLITAVTGLRLSLIARVTPERWLCAAAHDVMGFGLKVGQELEVATTLCNEVRDSHKPIIIDDVPNDATYRDHHTPKIYGLKSYIAVPIFRQDGSYFGNVCALDSEPRALTTGNAEELMTLLAQLVSFHLEQDERHRRSNDELSDARTTGKLRDEFIAILGHDLRTPLSSIVMTAGALAKKDDPEIAKLGNRIVQSGLRVGRMTSDVLDLARGQVGGGIPVKRRPVNVAKMVSAIVDESRAVNPGSRIMVDLHGTSSVNVDSDRVQQVMTNLLANAVTHGEKDAPVVVDARVEGKDWVLTVSNQGTIAEDKRRRLFEPYSRGGGEAGGLGLGLYIVAQIMKSHGGTVELNQPTPKRTSFVCRFPDAA